MAYVVDEFRLDPELFELTRQGERIALEPQAFDVLVYLVVHRGRVVSKEELMDSIWGGRFVTEAAVTSRIKQVRRALGDDGEAQRLIRTVHGRGYRFVGPIQDEAGRRAVLPDTETVTPAGSSAADASARERRDGRAPSPGNHNLIGSLQHLIGRGAELAAVADALDAHRLITILGTGGIGKTRLALEAARSRRDADGPWFVQLAGLSDGSLLVETVSTVLSIPSAADAVALAQVLRERRLLLVLDNCEQVADDVAPFVTALLERCPDVQVLLTSRQRLGAPGEYVVELAPLGSSAAEQLFLERAAVVLPGWAPDAEERAALAELCDGLDRLPLAIELAAGQCRALSVTQLAEQLGDRFALLGGRRGNHRHASMTAAVAWSYDSLSGAERELFEALCLLEGSFDLDGVRAVSGDQAALPTKLSLIDKSLVVVLHGSPRRYRILETLRQYAEQRRSADRTAQVRQQIVTWVSSAAERAETEMYGPNSRTWMVRLDQDKGTIRAALGWRATRPPGSASPWAWCGSGIGAVTPWRPSAPSSRCHRRAQPCRHPPRDCRPRCWSEARSVSCCFGTWPATTNGCPLPAALDQARGLAAITDDESARSYALAAIAYFEAGSGQIEQALINAGTAAEIVRRLGSDQFLSFSLLTMGMAHLRAGSVAEAERCAAAGVCHADACGYAWGAVASSWIMCKARIAAGDFSEPTVIGLARVIGASSLNRDITSWLVGLVSEAYLFLRRGDGQRAAELVGIASRQGQRIGFTPEAMDPVETRLFLDETMQAIQERGLTTWYEQGRGLDTQRAFERVAELVSSVAPEPG